MKLITNNIIVQPVISLRYFHKEKSRIPNDISTAFYLSWEDVLWDICKSFQIKHNSVVLVPSFFCVDVMNNMKAHGLNPQYYEVDSQLQPVKSDLLKKINQTEPAFIVLFHAVGITNNLVTKEFIQKISKDIFIIEDCVHRITNPEEVHIYSEKHVLINSLRKVVPLQGSCIFAKKNIIKQLQGPHNTFLYSSAVIVLWLIMQFNFLLQKFVIKHAGLFAEWSMLKGYDIIGDNVKPGYCPRFFYTLYTHLDFHYIKKIKQEQANLYTSLICHDSESYTPKFNQSDKGELRGYPIVMQKTFAKKIIQQLRSKKIYIRPELIDSKWTQDRDIMYLPMGLHVTKYHIHYLASLFNSSVTNYSKSS